MLNYNEYRELSLNDTFIALVNEINNLQLKVEALEGQLLFVQESLKLSLETEEEPTLQPKIHVNTCTCNYYESARHTPDCAKHA